MDRHRRDGGMSRRELSRVQDIRQLALLIAESISENVDRRQTGLWRRFQGCEVDSG